MTTLESIASMEPMLPSVGDRRLEDLALDLATKASALAGRLPTPVRQGVGDLLRSMNCYYSNLIEGHDTHPRDIDRALAHADYAADPVRRALQREAVAHIEVQRIIDRGEDPADAPTSVAYITWLHREFCRRLPEELLFVENPDTGERLRVLPGEMRQGGCRWGGTFHRMPGRCRLFSSGSARCMPWNDYRGWGGSSPWARRTTVCCGYTRLRTATAGSPG